MYVGSITNHRISDNILKYVVFISIIIIFAFSNIRGLSIGVQFIFVSITLINILIYKKVRLSIHFLWMFLFILWGLFVTLFSEYSITSLIEVSNLALKLLFYTSLILFITNEEKFMFVLKAIVFSGLILIGRVILLTPLSDWGTERLGSALDLNPNTLGLSLAFAAIISTYLAKNLNHKYYYLFTILFMVIGLLTGSRKVLLAIVGGILLLIYLTTKDKVKKFFTIIFIGLLLFIIYRIVMEVPVFYEIIGDRIEGAMFFSESAELDKSTLHRSMMIGEALNLFQQSPITGIGLENFRFYSSFNSYSHNNYMEILASTGIIGFILYYSLPLMILLSSLYFNRKSDYSLIIAILVTILMLDIANVSYRQLITQVMIALCTSKYILLKKHKMSINHYSINKV